MFKLLIVDSIMALFRVDYSGRGELAERQQTLAQMMSKLQKISEEYNVAVLVTNQMTSDPGATMSFQVHIPYFTSLSNSLFRRTPRNRLAATSWRTLQPPGFL